LREIQRHRANAQIRAKARRLKRDRGLSLLVVDYLQLVVPTNTGRGTNRQEEVSSISRGLKGLAKELKVPVLVLSQLTRAPERDDRKPQLSDLRESGAIEQDADVVIFLWESSALNRFTPDAKVSWKLAKQRNGPKMQLDDIQFEREYTRFREAPDAGA